MKSRYFFPLEFRTNLNIPSELPECMTRRFHVGYYVDQYLDSDNSHSNVCKMVEDKELKDWYHVTHLKLAWRNL